MSCVNAETQLKTNEAEIRFLRNLLYRLCGALELDDENYRRRVVGQIKADLSQKQK